MPLLEVAVGVNHVNLCLKVYCGWLTSYKGFVQCNQQRGLLSF